MGRQAYDVGEFRFQAGRKPYPGDTESEGPEGGGFFNFMADRRGTQMRPVNEGTMDDTIASYTQFAQWAGMAMDENDTAVDSCLVTTLGSLGNAGSLNGSFGDTASWRRDDRGHALTTALLGHTTRGPLLMLSSSPPGGVGVHAGSSISTEVVRAVVDGSCTIGQDEYTSGDIRIDVARAPAEPVQAGPDGLKEIVIFGDREPLFSTLSSVRWSPLVEAELRALEQRLADRDATFTIAS
jgi:hypothetical protein